MDLECEGFCDAMRDFCDMEIVDGLWTVDLR